MKECYTGIVADKNEEFVLDGSAAMARGNSNVSYSFRLDSAKEFLNVEREHYDGISIGEKITVHVIPGIGEITEIEIH